MSFLEKNKDSIILKTYQKVKAEMLERANGDYRKAIDIALEKQLVLATRLAHLKERRFVLFRKTKITYLEIAIEALKFTVKEFNKELDK